MLFSGDGSSGDLLPLVLMAREFQAAGHEVCVCGSSEFSRMAQDFAVPFEPYPHNYTEIYLENQRPGYLHNIRENIRHQERLYRGEFEVLSKIAPQFDVLVSFMGEIFVPAVAEAFGLLSLRHFTFPVLPSDRYGAPSGLPIITENRLFNRFTWRAAVWSARYLFSYDRTVTELRARLGLGPVDDLLAHNACVDHLLIGLYEELMPPCPSWEVGYSYIGPCLPSAPVPLSEPLESFLQAGPPPVYIGFGSMVHPNSAELTRILIDAARGAGLRTIIAQAKSSLGEGLEDSDDVFVLREYPIPHHILFPRCHAAIHHGSWITTHLAARAGTPQLVLAQASDQFMWGDIVQKKQLGPEWIDMNRLKERRLRAAIESLVHTERFATNARGLASRVREIDGPKNAVALFEREGERWLRDRRWKRR